MLAATTIGNALEFFDFTVYAFFAVTIGKLFFPVSSPEGQLLLSVATFGVGFISRPLGGFYFGQYADRHGRKAAMTLTITLMALACAMIALAPTYADIGIAAPIIIVAARMIQGFSVGGEVGVGITMLVESSHQGRRAYYASWNFGSQGLGIMLGALLAAGLAHFLPPASLETFGWRIPFLMGVLIAPVGLFIRLRLDETLAPPSSSSRALPLPTLLRTHKAPTVLGVLLCLGAAVSAYIIMLHMPLYAVTELHLPQTEAIGASVLGAAMTFVAAPFVGKLADSHGRKLPIYVGRALSLTAIYPAYAALNADPSLWKLFAIIAVLSLLLTLHVVPALTLISEILPNQIRATGMSVAYSLGVSLFGGFAPFIAVWLVHITHDPLAPAYYMIATLLISTLALPFIVDRTLVRLDAQADSY